MTERVCQQCGYEVASQTGRVPRDCPQCDGDLASPGADIPAEVVKFAEEHGLDPAEVQARRVE